MTLPSILLAMLLIEGAVARAATNAPGGLGLPGWPASNEWSWDGSWTPKDTDFPLAGLLDDKYFDGHRGPDGNPTPILPPGQWDYPDDHQNNLSNWTNFKTNLGFFERLGDSLGRHYGWHLVPNRTRNFDYSGAAIYFEGSSGPDILALGDESWIEGFGEGSLGDGPDILVFQKSHTLDFRTGSSKTGHKRDDDLVVGGCGANPDGSWDIDTTTVHTGPDSDWVFIRDLDRSAVDLGNGSDGRTDSVDKSDGDDLVELRGNTHDFRVFGGNGNDTAVWYVDDNVQVTPWLGPNFFGSGGWGDALWNDEGIDRLVLAVPPSTRIVTKAPESGALLVKPSDGSFIPDKPTEDDLYARYCIECGKGPGGRKTVIMEYVSEDGGRVDTGYFYVTAFEELQIGVGPDARVYTIDDAHGALKPAPGLPPFAAPAFPPEQICGPTAALSDVGLDEGDDGVTNAVFTVTLSSASDKPVSLALSTADGTAKAGSDYSGRTGIVTVPPGQTTGRFSVPVIGDLVKEPDETFFANVTGATNVLVDRKGVGTIRNDDN